MVGHDLRNPLQGIAGAVYLLKNHSSTTREQKELCGIIESSIEYSNDIVNDLLDFSMEIQLQFQDTTPRAIVEEALHQVEIPKSVRILNSTQNEPRITADANRIRRVFVNIIENAIDAMPHGGTLEIDSGESNGNFRVTFSDTGTGIPPKIIENLWKPLQTTKAKGIGLGLAICKRLVDAHGGSISMESTVGKGSTFTVEIPTKPKTETSLKNP